VYNPITHEDNKGRDEYRVPVFIFLPFHVRKASPLHCLLHSAA